MLLLLLSLLVLGSCGFGGRCAVDVTLYSFIVVCFFVFWLVMVWGRGVVKWWKRRNVRENKGNYEKKKEELEEEM